MSLPAMSPLDRRADSAREMLHPHLLERARRRVALLEEDRGAATAEYAVVIMAAVGFAGLLVVILRSGEVRTMLTDLVRDALGQAG